VLIIHEVDDDAWKADSSPRPARIREEAGVRAPAFLYLDEVDAGAL
jgi:hypothetical protein